MAPPRLTACCTSIESTRCSTVRTASGSLAGRRTALAVALDAAVIVVLANDDRAAADPRTDERLARTRNASDLWLAGPSVHASASAGWATGFAEALIVTGAGLQWLSAVLDVAGRLGAPIERGAKKVGPTRVDSEGKATGLAGSLRFWEGTRARRGRGSGIGRGPRVERMLRPSIERAFLFAAASGQCRGGHGQGEDQQRLKPQDGRSNHRRVPPGCPGTGTVSLWLQREPS